MTSMTSTTECPAPPAPTPRKRPLLRRLKALPPWSLIAVGTVTGGLAGGAYGVLTPPAYSATSYVVVVPSAESDPQSALGFAQAYGRVATQLAVLGDAQVWAGVPVKTLRDSVRSATSPDAPMVSLTATSARAGLATDMANAVSRSLIEYAKDTKGATHVELLQLSRAVKPTEPSSAPPALTGLVGAGAGVLLGGLALLVRPRPTAADAARTVAVPGPATAADAQGQP
ncbi:lipopolysaccharide biosynthesis protein [Streptomyces sp. D2-8]|uniref:lipopolysaccharide biosynthesis protein n=1 Tax=Streptomyces sp. D2-8 TaxID=2707767 RepID=UPI0035B3C7D5